jgi:hypothetical protein
MSTNKFVVRQISTGQFVSIEQGTRLTKNVISSKTKFDTKEEAMNQAIEDERVAIILADTTLSDDEQVALLFA